MLGHRLRRWPNIKLTDMFAIRGDNTAMIVRILCFISGWQTALYNKLWNQKEQKKFWQFQEWANVSRYTNGPHLIKYNYLFVQWNMQ